MATEKEIEEILKDCSEPDWNGYGGLPVTKQKAERILTILRYFPEFLKQLDPGAECTGNIGFTYDNGQVSFCFALNDEGHLNIGGSTPFGGFWGSLTFNFEMLDKFIENKEKSNVS